jgi:very-short-patch-repair endonuclease
VVARRQLTAIGLSRAAIESRLRRGTLLSVHRGVYAVGHRCLTMRARWMAAVLACGPGAVLSHGSAARLWGILASGTSAAGVTAPRELRARVGISAHMSVLEGDEVEAVEGIPVTSVSRTLLDIAGDLDAARLERALHEAEVRRLTSKLSLPMLLRRHPGRRGVGALRALLDGRSALGASGFTRNDLEAELAELIRAAELPRPRLNADLAVRGRFFNVDCLWPRARLVVEFDGRRTHGTARAFETDRERDRLLLTEGWRVIRVTERQLRHEPERILSDLRELLAASTLSR